MKVVFSYGGSVLAPGEQDVEFARQLAGLLTTQAKKQRIAVVVGGGAPARARIKAARKAKKTPAACDHEGILATRENAKVLQDALGEAAYPHIPTTLKDAADAFGKKRKVLVMGGTEPGHSTDGVGALLADWVGADLFINASNIDWVYDKDPKKYALAKKIQWMTSKRLIELVAGESQDAGAYALMDVVAAKTLERNTFTTIVCNGRDLDNINRILDGKDYQGTTITSK